jgi:hypothetical protein
LAGADLEEIQLAGLDLRQKVDLLAELAIGENRDFDLAAGALAHVIGETLHRRMHRMGRRKAMGKAQFQRFGAQHRRTGHGQSRGDQKATPRQHGWALT